MEIIDDFGLPVALIGPDEWEAQPWLEAGALVALVRMQDPPESLREELTERGFLCKPSTVTWLSRLGASEEEFLRGLPRKSREPIVRAQRRIEREGLREVIEEPVSPEHLDSFLTLYEEQVGRMRYGVAFARRFQETILHGPEKYFGVFLLEGDELVGGCVALECPDESAIRVRWSAVTDRARAASLPRALYRTAMRVAREKGCTWGTLGDDPNLYGHLAQPGLFTFKAQMGFQAVPSQDFADPMGCDEADLVLSLDLLTDPVLALTYAGSGRALRSCVVSRSRVDVQWHSAPFLAGTVVQPPGLLR
jgi:GNAT superfamily N-acetyltransferase